MSELSQSTIENIRRARMEDAHGRHDRPLVPYRSIGELLAARAEQYEVMPFLIFHGEDGVRREFTFSDFYEHVCRAANLLSTSGVRAGDRVVIASPNYPDVVIQYFALFLLGAVAVPLNLGEDDTRLRFIMENSRARVILARDSSITRIASLAASIAPPPMLFQVGQRTMPDIKHYDTELAAQRAAFTPSTDNHLAQDSLLVYTSGTTGHPKGVVLDQYNLLVDAMSIAEWHQISDDQRMMCVLPLHHVNGIVVTLLTPLYAGAAIVLTQQFHPGRFFDLLTTERVSIASVVPTLLQFLLHTKIDVEAYKLVYFRHLICGAGPLTVELAQKYEQAFRQHIIHGYGLSETTCYSCFLPVDLSEAEHKHWMSAFGFPSIGIPLPVNEMAIHAPDGTELEEGERGEIVVRGHNVMARYFENPEANADSFAHGWFRTGDEGFFQYDDQGRTFFFITGRLKELIIRGGTNLSPFEIDEVLMNIPGVQAGIAVGFDNEWYGEEVGAYITLRDGMMVTPEDVIRYCRRSLPFSKSPKVVIIGDTIPVTSTGKYQRNLCKSLFAKYRDVQFKE